VHSKKGEGAESYVFGGFPSGKKGKKKKKKKNTEPSEVNNERKRRGRGGKGTISQGYTRERRRTLVLTECRLLGEKKKKNLRYRKSLLAREGENKRLEGPKKKGGCSHSPSTPGKGKKVPPPCRSSGGERGTTVNRKSYEKKERGWVIFRALRGKKRCKILGVPLEPSRLMVNKKKKEKDPRNFEITRGRGGGGLPAARVLKI